MSNCSHSYLPLCSIPSVVSRDGHAGPNALQYIPFLGFHLFSGETITFPDSQVPQNKWPFMAGGSKPDTFEKSGLSL